MCNSEKRLDIVGIGPGSFDYITNAAKTAIEKAEVIVGYTTYLDLIRVFIKKDQKTFSSGMRQEKKRCEYAITEALKGKRVALICSGDPGIYALSSLVFELLRNIDLGGDLKVTVISGITSLTACAALLGAPIGHDFAVISLSDILTPWHIIERRIDAAAMADFVIAFYNPKSKRRVSQLEHAISIVKRYRQLHTPVGIVKKAMRDGQKVVITTLKDMFKCKDIDMQTTVIIGNSSSYIWNNKIITPRGYNIEK